MTRSLVLAALTLALFAPVTLATHDGEPLVSADACQVPLEGPSVACGLVSVSADAGQHPGSDGNSWLFAAKACAGACVDTGEVSLLP